MSVQKFVAILQEGVEIFLLIIKKTLTCWWQRHGIIKVTKIHPWGTLISNVMAIAWHTLRHLTQNQERVKSQESFGSIIWGP